jgi:hypothetical protein
MHDILFLRMFSRHYRAVKAILGFTDAILISLSFMLAYQTRTRLHFEHVFYLDFPVIALLLTISVVCWIGIGFWLSNNAEISRNNLCASDLKHNLQRRQLVHRAHTWVRLPGWPKTLRD